MPNPPSDFDRIAANPPGGTAIPELENLLAGLQQGMGGPPQLAGTEETARAMENIKQFQATMTAHNAAASRPPQPTKTTTKTDPNGNRTISIEGPAELAEYYGKAGQFYQEALGGFAKQLSQVEQQTQMREQQAREHPWIQLATALSANLANQKDMPGWVRGLGQTAAQLNPTADELRNQRLAMIQQEASLAEKGAGLSIAQQKSMADTKQAELQRKTLEGADKRASDYLNKTRVAARGGAGPLPYEAFQSGAIASGVAPERVPGLYQAHVEEAKLASGAVTLKTEEAKKLKTFGETLREQGDVKRGEIQKGVKIAGINQAFANSVSPTKMDFEETLHEHKKAIDEAAAQSKEFKVLGPQVGTKLTQASATNGYLDTVEHMLEQPEFAEVQGPLFSFDPKTKAFKFNEQAVLPKQFKGIDRTVVESQISHEIPRLLTLLLNGQAGGASILRTDVGKKLVADMGITGQVRPDQALAILKIVRDTNNNNIASNMRAKKDANWGALKDLVGASDPRNDYFFKGKTDSFGAPVVPFPDVNRRAADKTTPAAEISKDDYDQWLKAQGNK